MSEAVKSALRAAIERKRLEMDELEAALRKVEREEREAHGPKRRRRKETGIKPGSVPSLALAALREAGQPMTAAELADAISTASRPVPTRILAAALKRYLDGGRYFRRTPTGLYEVVEEL